MEQINYQEEYRKLFSAYRENSDAPDISDRQSMKALIERFPYCQPAHFIYAAGLRNNPSMLDSQLSKISILSPQREALYQTIHHPEKMEFRGTILRSAEEPEFKGPEPLSLIEQPIVLERAPWEEPEEEYPAKNNADFTEAEAYITEEPDIETGEDESVLMDSITSESFFTPDVSAEEPLTDLHEEKAQSPQVVPAPINYPEKELRDVTAYNDDKMPFTFLWWLNKTRKEHAHTYQPYLSFKLDTSQSIRKNVNDELNQQIMENIFHLQISGNDKKSEAGSKTIEFKVKRKDEELIEKFIKEDPQIRPMQPDKISTENMARKSSEDHNDVVSETLARIYIEQMLYDKAIDAYKKLSLKFPEKNAYFADQISNLEKKLN